MAAAREERQAVPDLHMKINEIMAERDLVLVYFTVSGTNTHEGMGFPATGKSFTGPAMTLFRFKAGKIIEEWSVWDMLSSMQQLGLLPQQGTGWMVGLNWMAIGRLAYQQTIAGA
jgi:steroid delta-isomerase-like uncharacterized protein